MEDITPEQRMQARMLREIAAGRVEAIRHLIEKVDAERGKDADYTPHEYDLMAHDMGFALLLLLTAVLVYIDPMDDLGPIGTLPPKDRVN